MCRLHIAECTVESTVWSPRCSGGRRPLRRNLDLHEPGKVQPCKTEGNPWWRENINQLCVLDLDASPVLILIITSELNPEGRSCGQNFNRTKI